ncbi:hypothetical protein D3C77_460370 [compost metagenome]
MLPVGGIDILLQIALLSQSSQQRHRFAISVVHRKWLIHIQSGVREVLIVLDHSWHIEHPTAQWPFVFKIGREWNNTVLLQLLAGLEEFIPCFWNLSDPGIGKSLFVINDSRSRVTCRDSV